mmetsp:Transcript_18079/g.26523  ORF Transcript_18079/g.26523 Transcript_18079/m.26523 type:complete len:262 (-) Transcript_18079:104-889(-)|eukprot:CAMPEP_0195515074 /NCGR_PEP_ID=MMETSP0794_2-20130614/6268_1 /TAXON_ID=515487 /ORGANISM="Stephanopyxis turris, Strain CCMP 815" /LENGTH=261 /DNA_ID=CAMNT_0040643455 /DNA_START=144 /DNA_END=929 /DNA_ORIENTATION=+
MKRGYQISPIEIHPEQNAVTKKPKECLAQIGTSHSLDEAHKTLSMALHIKKMSDLYVEEVENLLEDTKRQLEAAKRKHHDALKLKRDSEAQIKQVKAMVVKAELHESNWERMFEKLVEYKIKHGNCIVPHQYTSNLELKRLGRWVGSQRLHYKYYNNGRKSPLTPHRIKELDKLGFVWNLNEHRWYLMYEKLVAYHTKSGTCLVPCKYDADPGLANWCRTQRDQWHRLQKGCVHTLTADRIKVLNDIGFISKVKTEDILDK